MRQETDTDLNLTECDIVGKRPVGNPFFGFSAEQVTTWRSITGTREKPKQNGGGRYGHEGYQCRTTKLSFAHDLYPENLLVRQRNQTYLELEHLA